MFSTADGTAYHLNYLHGELSPGELRRAFYTGAPGTMAFGSLGWRHLWLGAGKHLLVHEIIWPALAREGEEDPDTIFIRWQSTLGTPLLSRQERYRWLVDKVKAFYPPEGTPAELTWYEDCEDEINLWTYWQGRGCLEPKILVVGKDWGDPRSREGQSALDGIRKGRPYLEDNVFPADVHLGALFREVFGLDLNKKHRELFFTNLLLGYRSHGNSGNLYTPLDQDSAFFKELVHILCPRAVVCLGEDTFACALRAHGERLPYTSGFNAALDGGQTVMDLDGIRFFGMAHCGNLGCMNRAGRQKGAGPEVGLRMQRKDWEQVRDYCHPFI